MLHFLIILMVAAQLHFTDEEMRGIANDIKAGKPRISTNIVYAITWEIQKSKSSIFVSGELTKAMDIDLRVAHRRGVSVRGIGSTKGSVGVWANDPGPHTAANCVIIDRQRVVEWRTNQISLWTNQIVVAQFTKEFETHFAHAMPLGISEARRRKLPIELPDIPK